jgi:hypothetical protein
MSRTSMPRAATSVATSVSTRPDSKRASACSLRLVAVHGDRVDAGAAEPLDQPVGAALGADEDEREVAVVAERLDERVELVVVRDGLEAVLDRVDPLLVRRVGVLSRVLGVGLGDAAGLTLEGGREEQRLPVLRAQVHDPVDGRLEAHVEHPVGLVEDQDLDVAQVEGAAVEEVLEPAGRRDDDLRAGGVLGLLLDADAAVDGGDLERTSVRHRPDLLDDLRDQLAGRRQDQRRGTAVGRLDLVDHRHAEGERLAGTGRGLREHVATGEHVSDDELLDREGLGDAALGERAANSARYAEVGERL